MGRVETNKSLVWIEISRTEWRHIGQLNSSVTKKYEKHEELIVKNTGF